MDSPTKKITTICPNQLTHKKKNGYKNIKPYNMLLKYCYIKEEALLELN